jgi:hypothetical protein
MTVRSSTGSQREPQLPKIPPPPAANSSSQDPRATASSREHYSRQAMQELSQIAGNVIKADQKEFILYAIESIYNIASKKEIYTYANNGQAKCNLLEAMLQEPIQNYENEQSTWDDFKNSNPSNQAIKEYYKELMQNIGEWFKTDRDIRYPRKREIDENENKALRWLATRINQVEASTNFIQEGITGKRNDDEWKYTPFSKLSEVKELGLENPESLFLRLDFLKEFRQSRIDLLTDPESITEAQVHEIMKKIYNL